MFAADFFFFFSEQDYTCEEPEFYTVKKYGGQNSGLCWQNYISPSVFSWCV